MASCHVDGVVAFSRVKKRPRESWRARPRTLAEARHAHHARRLADTDRPRPSTQHRPNPRGSRPPRMLARASRRVPKQGLRWFSYEAPAGRRGAPRRVSACAAAAGGALGRAPLADDGISAFARDFMRHARRGIGAAEEDRTGASTRAPRIVELPTHGSLDPWSLDPQRAAHEHGAHAAGTHTFAAANASSGPDGVSPPGPASSSSFPHPLRRETTRPSPGSPGEAPVPLPGEGRGGEEVDRPLHDQVHVPRGGGRGFRARARHLR